jgi:hypothetical protein
VAGHLAAAGAPRTIGQAAASVASTPYANNRYSGNARDIGCCAFQVLAFVQMEGQKRSGGICSQSM